MSDDDVEDDALTPPDAVRVAKRAIVLASCACRASLERSPKDREAQRMQLALQEWVDDVGARDEFEDDEWKGVSARLGSLPDRITIGFGWRAEGLAVLAWALGRADLPPYDEQVDGPSLGDAIGFLDDSVMHFLASATLRSARELEWVANLTLALHWRLREFTLRPSAMDFGTFARNCQWARFPIDDLTLVDDDLALRGRPIAKAGRSLVQACCSIARERQQAANWLLGEDEQYSQVTCDT